MTKQAHITSRPHHEVGDMVLGLCGKEFKVKTLWADLPDDKPICRDCVDASIVALTETDALIEMARSRVRRLAVILDGLREDLSKDLALDLIHEMDLAHQDELEQRARDKEDRKQAKVTCTCVWTSQEMFEVNPTCPIHGDAKAEELIEEVKAIGVEDVQLPDDTSQVEE